MAEANLAQLFSDGLSQIETKKCDNLFKDLDSRDLTEAEESIIAQRVALQQRMLEEYEKREKARKVREILIVCPDLTEEEADCALKLHSYREEDAAAALTSGIAFRRKVQAMCGTTRPQPAGLPSRLPAPQCQSRTKLTAVGPVGARPAGDFLKHIGEGVFVGTFRGKGWELYKARPLLRPKSAAAAPPTTTALPPPQQKKRGRPNKAQELTPPRPRPIKRRALEAANTEPPLSPPTAAGRRRSGRLRSADNASSLPSTAAIVSGDARQPESQGGAQTASAEPGKEGKQEAAELNSEDGSDYGKVAPVPPNMAEAVKADSQALPDTASSGVLENANAVHGDSIQGTSEQTEQCLDMTCTLDGGPGVPLEVPPASPQAAAVPRRQRGGRRRRGTPLLPWTEPSGSATSPDDQAQSDSDASRMHQSPLGQQAHAAQCNPAVTSGTILSGDPMLEQKTPAAEEASGKDRGADVEQHPALEDHQVTEVSSADAPPAKHSKRSRATSGEDSDSAPARDAGEARPKRQRRASAKATEALLNITLAADMQAWGYPQPSTRPAYSKSAQVSKKVTASLPSQQQSPRRSPRAHLAASPRVASGAPASAPLVNKPRLGRVKRCSSKQVELLCIGELRLDAGWHNNGYIFPDGFCTRTVFRSSVELDQLCMHTCSILGQEGPNWPAPTFRIVAADRPDEVLDAKSPTGAWNAVLSRINNEIEARRMAGEDLPPPPKTAIAGPEYFGLTHPELLQQIEALDPEGLCTAYWAGKEDRLAYGQVHGIAPDRKGTQGGAATALPRTFAAPSGGAARRRRRGGRGADADGNGVDDAQDDIEEVYAGNRWSGVDRAERARRRAGEDISGGGAADADNPLPHVIDPITLEPVVTPAMSPAGHVMGLATWTAVLAEQGKCPFTQQPLRRDQITVLTKSNLDRFRDRLKLP